MKAGKLLASVLILIMCRPLAGYAQVSEIEVSARYHPASRYLPPADSASRPGKANQAEINVSAMINIHTRVDSAIDWKMGGIPSFIWKSCGPG